MYAIWAQQKLIPLFSQKILWLNWAIKEKILTGGVDDMEFPWVSKNQHVKIAGVN